MLNNIWIWFRSRYHRIVNSIAFYPACIALLFVILAALIITFDFSESGRQLKSKWQWLRLKDAATARSIIAAIAGGIISLTVFSFSMVMIVLNSAASQMSNRVLDKLIGNRFQQLVLGTYIGTIVYALFLLSTIRDIDSGIYIPALSTYLLILVTIFDIFLFIYFLHYITQSVKYQVIIERIYKDTKSALAHYCRLQQQPPETVLPEAAFNIPANTSGVYEGFNRETLITLCDQYDCTLHIIHTRGTFILKGLPFLKVNKPLPDQAIKNIHLAVYLHSSESIEENFFYGFRQLMEVAVKALSPGVNDPGTAIESLRALFRLFTYRICFFPDNVIRNKKHQVRIITNELTFERIFTTTVLPVWDYGKNDRMIREELAQLLTQLQSITVNATVGKLLQEVKQQMKQDEKD